MYDTTVSYIVQAVPPSAPQAAGDDTAPGGQQRPPRPLVAVAHRQPQQPTAEIRRPQGDGVASAGRTQLIEQLADLARGRRRDRKSTRLNSSHDQISYAVFCLKKKNTTRHEARQARRSSNDTG